MDFNCIEEDLSDIMENYLMVRIMKHWNWFPKKPLGSLEDFKSRLGKHLAGMTQVYLILP